MNLFTIQKLRILNKSLSRQELIDKYYTKNQKNELRRLKYITILLLITIIATFTTMLIWNPFFQLYKQYSIITLIGLSVIFTIPAIFIGRALSKTRKKCGMVVLTRTFYQKIIGNHINSIDEGLNLIRFHKLKEFCKQESITITKEHLLFIKEQLIEDLKDTEIDNLSLAKKWFKATLVPLGTSLFSVYLSKYVDTKNLTSIFVIMFIFTLLIGYIIILINTWQNNRKIKRMNKYQDLLKIIDIALFELIKEKSGLLS